MIELGLRTKSIIVCFSGGTVVTREWAIRSLMKVVGVDGSKYDRLVVVDPISSAFSKISFSRELVSSGISDDKLRTELQTLLAAGDEVRRY